MAVEKRKEKQYEIGRMHLPRPILPSIGVKHGCCRSRRRHRHRRRRRCRHRRSRRRR